jgi:hypothetical protein
MSMRYDHRGAGQQRLQRALLCTTCKKTFGTLLSRFLQALITATEQLAQPERWRRLLARIFEKYLEGRPLGGPLPALASG